MRSNMKKTAIFEGVLKAVTSSLKNIKESIDVPLEEASTLSKLIGGSPGGQRLVSWLHKHDKLSSTATYDEITSKTDRVMFQLFKSDPDHFLIIQTAKMTVGVKPNLDYVTKSREKNPDYDPSSDKGLQYSVVAFNNEERLDHKISTLPSQDEFKNAGDPEAAYQAAKEKVLALRAAPGIKMPKKKKGEKKDEDAPTPTLITVKRGGKPFSRDTRNPENIFDLIREVGGGITRVFAASGKGPSLGIERDRPKKELRQLKKNYRGQYEPTGEVPKSSYPVGSNVERAKIAARRPVPTYDAEQELEKAAKTLQPVFRKLGVGGSEARDLLIRAAQAGSQLAVTNPKFGEWLGNINQGERSKYIPLIQKIKELLSAG